MKKQTKKKQVHGIQYFTGKAAARPLRKCMVIKRPARVVHRGRVGRINLTITLDNILISFIPFFYQVYRAFESVIGF